MDIWINQLTHKVSRINYFIPYIGLIWSFLYPISDFFPENRKSEGRSYHSKKKNTIED